jgi:hypothetical protein
MLQVGATEEGEEEEELLMFSTGILLRPPCPLSPFSTLACLLYHE